MTTKTASKSRGPLAKNVDEYLSWLPEDQKDTLEHVRQIIKSTIPEVVESITYQIPTYKFNNKRLIYFAAFKNHLSLIPISKDLFEKYEAELPGLDHKGDTLHFSPKQPIPDKVLIKLIEERLDLIS